MTNEPPYPEHKKLTAIHDHSQACYDFLEWLEGKGIHLAKYDEVTETCRACGHDDDHPKSEGAFPIRQCANDACECEWPDHGNPNILYPYLNQRDALLAEHFNIDLRVIEQEKRAMLASMRELNKGGSSD